MYNEGVHCMGSHTVYSCWYIKSHMLADIKRRKFQIIKLKHMIQCVKYWRWNMKCSVRVLYGDVVV